MSAVKKNDQELICRWYGENWGGQRNIYIFVAKYFPWIKHVNVTQSWTSKWQFIQMRG